MHKRSCFFSPAKINLFLHITGKRNDGYHELASLMQALSFGDEISIRCLPGSATDSFVCNNKNLAFDNSNTIVKALSLFREYTKEKFSIDLSVDKRIPFGGGFGGGSSNAATVLFALNALLKTNLSDSVLRDLGKKIGADVPFFFSTGRSLCFGIGEEINEVPLVAEKNLTVVCPKNCHSSTPLVYKEFRFSEKAPLNKDQLLKDVERNHFQKSNDLEKPAFCLTPSLSQLKNELSNSGFDHVLMTGSGSGFYCLGDGKITESVSSTVNIWKTSMITRSPSSWYSPN